MGFVTVHFGYNGDGYKEQSGIKNIFLIPKAEVSANFFGYKCQSDIRRNSLYITSALYQFYCIGVKNIYLE